MFRQASFFFSRESEWRAGTALLSRSRRACARVCSMASVDLDQSAALRASWAGRGAAARAYLGVIDGHEGHLIVVVELARLGRHGRDNGIVADDGLDVYRVARAP